MSCIFGNFESEVTDTLAALSDLLKAPVTSIDQLRPGTQIGRLVALYLKREKLEGLIQGKSREIWQCNWEIILSHVQHFLPDEWKSIRAHEIVSDSGLLFAVTKLILQKLFKTSIKPIKRSMSRPTQSRQGPPRSLSKSRSSQQVLPIKPSVPEDLKNEIHTWLVDLQVIPPALYLHEFMYRMRTGLSLSDLINRLEGRAEVIHGVHKNPKNTSYCIANINKTLEYLRKIPKVDSTYLWSSAEIHEGSESHIYGLLSDIKKYYMHKYPNFLPRPRSNSAGRSLRRYRSVECMFDPITVTGAMKRSVVQWVNALGLERFVVFHQDTLKDYLTNGVLLCEVVGEIFQHKPKYTLRPTKLDQCVDNFNLALKVLNNRVNPSDRFPHKIAEPSEDIAWAVLWELMNNNRSYADSYDAVGMKGLEQSLIAWIDSMKLLPPRVTTILELVPGFRNGVLLASIVANVAPNKKLEIIQKPQTDHAALLNIRRALIVLRNEEKMNQKFTWKDKEIHHGDLTTIFGLLEDIHKFADGMPVKSPEPKPYLGQSYLSSTLKSMTMEVPPPRNVAKVKELEAWLGGIGIKSSGLAGETLREFKSGEKLCEIVVALERIPIEGIHTVPKTTAAALANIRKALEVLYKKPAFPSKYMYLDDQILNGDGKVIRSLLLEMKKIYKNRLAW